MTKLTTSARHSELKQPNRQPRPKTISEYVLSERIGVNT